MPPSVLVLSHAGLIATPWSVPTRLLCPWGFSRQGYCSGLPCPPPGDLPDPGKESTSPASAHHTYRYCHKTILALISPLKGPFVFPESFVFQ